MLFRIKIEVEKTNNILSEVAFFMYDADVPTRDILRLKTGDLELAKKVFGDTIVNYLMVNTYNLNEVNKK